MTMCNYPKQNRTNQYEVCGGVPIRFVVGKGLTVPQAYVSLYALCEHHKGSVYGGQEISKEEYLVMQVLNK